MISINTDEEFKAQGDYLIQIISDGAGAITQVWLTTDPCSYLNCTDTKAVLYTSFKLCI